MATNRELLKEAIADAKAVKEVALANAKATLEEAFTPQLQSMLSAKLQEMENEDLKEYAELQPDRDDDGDGNVDVDEDLDLNELLGELNEEEEMDSEEEMDTEEGEPLDLEDMTDEDLKKFIEDVISDMVASGELEAGEESEEEDEMEDMEGEDVEDEEDVNLDELLAEIEMEEDAMYEEDEMMDESSLDEDLTELFGLGKKGSGGTSFVKDFIKNNSAEIEKIASAKDLEAGKKLVAKFYNENVRKMDGSALRSDVSVLRTALGLGALGGAEKGTVSIAEVEAELAEAYSTIESLRKDLNEVNLLNAKLLYTNKIFKSKNLTESQKVNVLGMFDKATNVSEVKLVFETLSEGLKSKSNTRITESMGSASKSLGTTKTQPIVESNDMIARFQKLAGIIKD